MSPESYWCVFLQHAVDVWKCFMGHVTLQVTLELPGWSTTVPISGIPSKSPWYHLTKSQEERGWVTLSISCWICWVNVWQLKCMCEGTPPVFHCHFFFNFYVVVLGGMAPQKVNQTRWLFLALLGAAMKKDSCISHMYSVKGAWYVEMLEMHGWPRPVKLILVSLTRVLEGCPVAVGMFQLTMAV